jgi:hypothetical protein
MSDLPIIITEAGAQPTPPESLLTNLISRVAESVPGYTANLPSGLITDLASTATGAIALIDQARVDLINSCSPYGANIPLLKQLGNIYGVQQGEGTNTSVYVVFSGLAGFPIPKGFTVSDGNNQYSVVTDTVIPTSGQTEPVYCLATSEGSWAVPVGTVTQVITSVPKTQPVTCTNITDGLPGANDQTYSSYRAQVLRAGMSGVQGTPGYLRTELEKINGVQSNLVSCRQEALGKWVVVVGGGDPYEVGYAIYKAIPDISTLTNDVSNTSGAAVEKKSVDILDYPNTCQVPFVVPVSQTTTVLVTWNTSSVSYIDPTGIANASQQPIADYINSIAVGEPINIFQVQNAFLKAISDLVQPSGISMADVRIGINGVIAAPDAGSSLIYGDTYSYFSISASSIEVQQYGSTDAD